VRFPQIPFEARHYRDYNRNLKRIMKRNFPFEMSIRMLLKPANLPRPVRGPLTRLLVHGARGLMFM
jgi:hypothetical protein